MPLTTGRTNESVRAAALTIKTRRRDGGADAAAADAGKNSQDSQDSPSKEARGGEGDTIDGQGAGDKGVGEGATGGGKARTALAIAFTLRSSTYATMCIRELLKAHSEEAALGLRDV